MRESRSSAGGDLSPLSMRGLLAGASLIAISGLASRLLGVVRDRLFAARFGAGDILDAYFAAYRIPDLIYNLLVLGALSAALLPVVSKLFAEGSGGRQKGFGVANTLLTVTVLILSVVSAILFVFMPYLMPLLVPGFPENKRELVVTFSRIMLLQPLLLGVSSVLGTVLLSLQRFFAYAIAPVLYNLGIIAGVVLFVPLVGLSGIAWGVVLGACLHMAVQLFASVRAGFFPRLTLAWNRAGVRDVSRLFAPRLISLVASQVGTMTVTVLGSRLMAGAITAFLFAVNLQSVPIGLIGIPMAVAVFPFLSAAAAANNAKGFTDTLVQTIRVTLFLTLPASVFLLLLRTQVVRVFLGAGAFDWQDTTLTLTILGILALSVVSESLIPLLARAFFSLHDTWTPMVISLTSMMVNVILAVLFTPYFGVPALAWAFTISSQLQFVLMLGVLHARLGGLQDGVLLTSLGRAAVATMVAGLVIQGPAVLLPRADAIFSRVPAPLGDVLFGLKGLIAAHVDMRTFLGVGAQLAGSLIGGVLVFWIVSILFRAPETRLMWHALRSRYRGSYPRMRA